MKTKISLSAFFILLALAAFSNIRLPRLISDGMILQRDTRVSIWGWADPDEKVTVSLASKNYHAIADAEGKWNISLPPQKAGGPFRMTVAGKNTIQIRDILFGDVWLCSGQSNMELPMRRVKPLYEEEMRTANNPQIRFFTVPQTYNFKQPETDYSGGNWLEVNPSHLANFSAVGYFFATELYAKLHAPIGILQASLGGSPVQAWISEDALKAFPDYLSEAYKFRNDELIREITSSDSKRINEWYAESTRKDRGQQAPQWKYADTNDSEWETIQLPGYWNDKFPGMKNGVVWFRKEFVVSKEDVGKPGFLNLGRIVDADSVFINGKVVGNTTYQYPPRWYDISPGILKEGKNQMAVRVVSNSGKGGFVLGKPYTLKIGDKTIPLDGEWKIRQGCDMPQLENETFIRWKPLGLYNAMIAPLNQYAKKGIVWYQGEANTSLTKEYSSLLSALIRDWRTRFNQPHLPFVYAQLPNFMETKDQPSESNWALLRESQLKTLSVPFTGMSVNIDLGDWNDIHPMNKKPVGIRLARLAERIAYSKNIEASAPRYLSMRISGHKIILTFSGKPNSLMTKGGNAPRCFAIAGTDKKFIWAKARLSGNTITVWNDSIVKPVAVRYAWADNPGAVNLFDRAGNPVSPFRTDDW